jgi:hypothetical protein
MYCIFDFFKPGGYISCRREFKMPENKTDDTLLENEKCSAIALHLAIAHIHNQILILQAGEADYGDYKEYIGTERVYEIAAEFRERLRLSEIGNFGFKNQRS